MSIENIINEAWEKRDQINPASDQSLKDSINQVIDDLDSGKSRVAEKINGEWITHQHLKKEFILKTLQKTCQLEKKEGLQQFG